MKKSDKLTKTLTKITGKALLEEDFSGYQASKDPDISYPRFRGLELCSMSPIILRGTTVRIEPNKWRRCLSLKDTKTNRVLSYCEAVMLKDVTFSTSKGKPIIVGTLSKGSYKFSDLTKRVRLDPDQIFRLEGQRLCKECKAKTEVKKADLAVVSKTYDRLIITI